MPYYSFRMGRGNELQTGNASDCLNDDAAKNEAAGMFADMARAISERLQSSPDWQIEVADEAGKTIFRFKVAAESPG